MAAYALPPRLIEAETSGEDRLRKLLADLPVELHEAGLLLVVRTLPGSAHAIAAALDRARWPEVAGSIAGDDTLFVAFPDRGSLQRIKRRLVRLTGDG
jgi:transcriptional regulator of arginine metabolism